jgi:hypothetical protein
MMFQKPGWRLSVLKVGAKKLQESDAGENTYFAKLQQQNQPTLGTKP